MATDTGTGTFTVDVHYSDTFPVGPGPHFFHRFVIAAPDGTAAELAACQMTASHPGRTPVASVVCI